VGSCSYCGVTVPGELTTCGSHRDLDANNPNSPAYWEGLSTERSIVTRNITEVQERLGPGPDMSPHRRITP